MGNTITLERDLVVQGDRVLGRLERFDLPHTLGKWCSRCDRVVPVRNWGYHQVACYTVGYPRCSTIARFTPRAGKSRLPKVDWAAELAHLLK